MAAKKGSLVSKKKVRGQLNVIIGRWKQVAKASVSRAEEVGGKSDEATVTAARIAKGGAILAALIALVGTWSQIGAAFAKVSPSQEAEISYRRAQTDVSMKGLTAKEDDLVDVENKVRDIVNAEKNPEKLADLQQLSKAVSEAKTLNQAVQKKVRDNIDSSIKATSAGDGVAASVYHKTANEAIVEEGEARRKAEELSKKLKLDITIDPKAVDLIGHTEIAKAPQG